MTATVREPADGPDPKKRKTRLLRNPGRRSAPSAGGMSWWALSSADLDNAPLFTRYDIPRMLRDPRVRFGVRVLTSPLPKVRVRVRAESAAVRVFVEGQIRKWWRLAAVRLARRHLIWGAAAAVLEFAPDRRRVRLGAARVFAPHEVSPRVFRGQRGRFAGLTLGQEWVPVPHAVWYAGEAEAGPLWDTPRLAGAFDPWLEKNGRGGARHSRRLWYRKNAFGGGVMWHPKGTTDYGEPGAPDVQDNRDVARAQMEYMENGAALTFPSTTDENGKRVWDYEPPTSRPDVAGMLDYPQALDAEIDVGLGIPPEVVEAAETGSGWSGRAVPLTTFLGATDEMAALLLDCAEKGFLRELVAANFGRSAWWEAENLPLEETLARPSPGVGQPQSPQPADDPQPGPDGRVPYQGPRGGRGWTDPATGKHDYGDLAHEPGAEPLTPQEHRLLALAMVQARLDAGDADAGDVLDGLAELAADPAAVRRLLDPAADLGWEAYQGPRGGRGWRDTDTGRVRYQQARPFDRRDRSHADGREAHRLAHAIADGDGTAGDVQALSDHIVRLNRDQLGAVAVRLQAGFPSAARRDAMVSALLEHVRGRLKEDGTAAGNPERTDPEPKPRKPAATRSSTGDKRPDGTVPTDKLAVGDIGEVRTDELHADPSRFQYKVSNIGRDGVTQELKGVGRFNPELAGLVSAWRDPADGKVYVVNGHHRFELARRTGHGKLAVKLIDAPDARRARAVGALVNIAEGRGTAVDAAKFMRDERVGADELRDRGISLGGKVAADAAALTRLSDKAFQQVAEGTIGEAQAVAVARHLADPDRQAVLFKKLADREEEGKDWSIPHIERAAQKLARAGTESETSATLFGDVTDEHSTFDQEVDLEQFARSKLAQDLNDFVAVSSARRAGAVGGAGNVLNLGENQKRRQAAAEDLETFDRLKDKVGPVSAAVKKFAGELFHAKGKKAQDAVKLKALDAVRQAVADASGRRAGPAESPGAAADAGGPGHAGAAGAGGGGRRADPPPEPAGQRAGGRPPRRLTVGRWSVPATPDLADQDHRDDVVRAVADAIPADLPALRSALARGRGDAAGCEAVAKAVRRAFGVAVAGADSPAALAAAVGRAETWCRFRDDARRPGESARQFVARHYPELAARNHVEVAGADTPHGRANVRDAAEVLPQIDALAARHNVRTVLCDGPVTQVPGLEHLSGIRPRGHNTNKTWDTTAGCYDPASKRVVCGVGEESGPHARLAAHEVGHGLDDWLGLAGRPEVRAAHARLHHALTPYEQQEGPGGDAGVSEMLAETFAVWAKGGPAAVARRYDQTWADYAHHVYTQEAQ